jgi:hypothetical protein
LPDGKAVVLSEERQTLLLLRTYQHHVAH